MDGVFFYADMVKNQEASQFDPMIEEARSSSLQGEVARQVDSEVAMKAVLTGTDTTADALHPIKAIPGEQLHAGYSRSYVGFLLRDEKRIVTVNQDVVKQEMEHL